MCRRKQYHFRLSPKLSEAIDSLAPTMGHNGFNRSDFVEESIIFVLSLIPFMEGRSDAVGWGEQLVSASEKKRAWIMEKIIETNDIAKATRSAIHKSKARIQGKKQSR